MPSRSRFHQAAPTLPKIQSSTNVPLRLTSPRLSAIVLKY